MARGWLRRKKDSTLFCWRNAEGMERSRSLGSAHISDEQAWAKVGELKLDRLVAQADPLHITFGQLAEKYLATFPFKKQSMSCYLPGRMLRQSVSAPNGSNRGSWAWTSAIKPGASIGA
jgi:hypothetical protein